jgi:hypothetical protein
MSSMCLEYGAGELAGELDEGETGWVRASLRARIST